MSIDLTPEEVAITSPASDTAPTPEPAPAPSPGPAPAAADPPAAVVVPPKPEPQAPQDAPRGEPNAAFAAMRREIAELKRQLSGQAQPQKPEPPKPPALDQDPVANLDSRTGSVENAVKEMVEAQRAQAFQSQVLGAYQADAAKVAKENPAFTEAYTHWRDRTGAYFRHFNPGIDGAQLEQALNAHEFQFALNALRSEKSPAELILAAAKDLGWAAKPAAAAPARQPDPAADIIRTARAQAEATSPVAGTGATPAGELTPETLLAMSDEELAAVSPAKWAKAWQ